MRTVGLGYLVIGENCQASGFTWQHEPVQCKSHSNIGMWRQENTFFKKIQLFASDLDLATSENNNFSERTFVALILPISRITGLHYLYLKSHTQLLNFLHVLFPLPTSQFSFNTQSLIFAPKMIYTPYWKSHISPCLLKTI